MQRFLVLTTLLAACGGSSTGPGNQAAGDLPPATLTTDAAQAKDWATTASAPNMFTAGQAPVAAADLVLQANAGATCPVKTESGSSTTYDGGCTDVNGQVWEGRATSGANGITYDGFGFTGMTDCNNQMLPEHVVFDGTMHISPSGNGFSFTIDLALHGTAIDRAACTTTDGVEGAFVYHGSMVQQGPDTDGDGSPDESLWNGSGQVGSTVTGLADVQTSAERINSMTCEHEALDGATTITSGGHTIAINYDGGTDCSMDSTVHWSFDGADQGELSGVSCATGGGTSGLFVAGMVAFALRRRRARAAR